MIQKINNIFRPKLIQPKRKKLTVLVALCVHRGIDPETWTAIRALEACPDPVIAVSVKSGDALIDRSRSIVASRFLENKDYDILFFIDDDVVFDPVDVAKIANVMQAQNLDIVGGAYMKKQVKSPHLAIKTMKNSKIFFGPEAFVQEVDMVSTGFMAINRHVLEKMVEAKSVPLCHPKNLRFYPFFQPFPKEIDGEWIYLSEDWAFCYRAKKLGFKIWVDGTTKLGHAGRYVYEQNEMFRPAHKEVKNFEYLDDGSQVKATEVLDLKLV
jgi:hypothetical protein